ncbi:MAG: amidohydrolase family protein [Oscillospiraceae bacterium]|nr:amidohydrolase family protein [Oscillospiraceae bacterium]
MLAIINATLVLPDRLQPESYLLAEDGVITATGRMENVPELTGAEVYDAKGRFLAPGLVDIHCHAGGTTWFYEDPAVAARHLLKNGTTTVLPTLYFSMPKDELVRNFARIQAAMRAGETPNVAGFYTEAPYMNPKFGADRENNPWKGPICREEYLPVLEQAGKDARVWVVAPEREHIEDFVKDALAVNPNVHFAVGHSEATPYEVEALMPYGLQIATHHTNATGMLPKYPECRGVCVDEAVWYHDEIYAEIICDRMGIHVDPYMQRLVRKIKGADRIILISDACVFDGPVPEVGDYAGATDILFDWSGEIAGSKLLLLDACRNWAKHTGAGMAEVFRAASLNPSRAVGFTDRGEIKSGKRADLIVVDGGYTLQQVVFEGKLL